MINDMSVLGVGVCVPDAALRASLPFAASDIVREAIPPLLRRRSSQAMQMAFSAAVLACEQANLSPSELPAIFASVAGEIQTTDALCRELVKADGVISPSAFHNSVQNTAAGYWSIAQHCSQPATALAAGRDTVAMALLEAWTQLACFGGQLLLVCYDEMWPDCLTIDGGQPAFACAWVLAAGGVENSLGCVGRPQRGSVQLPERWKNDVEAMPIIAAAPFLHWLAGDNDSAVIAVGSDVSSWQIDVHR